MNTPLETARKHLEDGLRRCIRDKVLILNGGRSGNVVNILHEAVYDAYHVLLKGSTLEAEVELCGEHQGKISLPYAEAGAKNVDLALKLRGTETFLDAIFVKAPMNNYSQNRKNYEESMAGTFVKCRQAHNHLRMVFFDFLPEKDLYFLKDGERKSKNSPDLKAATLPVMDECHPQFYAHARYSYHPDLENALNKKNFVHVWKRLEAAKEKPLSAVNVEGILKVLVDLVQDLSLAVADAKASNPGKVSMLNKGLDIFEARVTYGSTDKELNKGLGLIFAALGGYGLRQRVYLNNECMKRWSQLKPVERDAHQLLLNQELTQF